LGRLPADHFLGGEMSLDLGAALREITAKIANPLGLEPIEAAAGIVRVINIKMAYAVRAITLERGLDPAKFALLAFGGAGPMHALAVASQLGIPEVIVPVGPGAFSALGMLVSDIRHDFVRTFLVSDEALAIEPLNARFAEMIEEGRDVLAHEGATAEQMDFACAVD